MQGSKRNTVLEDLLRRYLELRSEAKDLKRQRVEISKELGGCEIRDVWGHRCYQTDIGLEDYCEPCQKKDPLYRRLRSNSYERVAIMTRLRNLVTIKQGRGDD